MSAFDIKSLSEVVLEEGCAAPTEVAVIIPLYNYRAYILECLASVVAQTLERISILLIDDCSADDGLTVAVGFLKANARRFTTIRVLRHLKNQGLSMARNTGIAWSSEPLLFMLDADNCIRPPALERLKSALDTSGVDFAYSQLFKFGERSAVGAADIWNVDRLRHGNTIDAMALIRRTALITAGGYAVLADDHGYEDYDLWCRFFTLGMQGVFLPELLCEYRRHRLSMLAARTDHHLPALQAEMAIRHPEVFNRQVRVPRLEEDYALGVPLEYKTLHPVTPSTIAVVVHMFVESQSDEILTYIANIPYPVDVFVSTDTAEKKQYIEDCFASWSGHLVVRVIARRGRDIAPRLIGLRDLYDKYEFVLFIHTKASSHAPRLRNWRRHLLEHLLGSREIVESIFEIFTQCPEIGIVAPQHLEGIREWLGWGDNFELSRRLARRLGVEMHINATLDFPSGSMFWARTAALTRLWDALSLDDFPYDHLGYQLDGTMAHAVERLFFVAAEVAGFSWVKVAYPKAFEYTRTIKFASDASELRELIKRYTRKLLTKEMMLESEKDDNHA